MAYAASSDGGAWENVTGSRPCPICTKPDWCSITADGFGVVCRRNDWSATYGKGDRRQDESGPYYYYNLRPKKNGEPNGGIPLPKFAMGGDRADADTLNSVYTALIAKLRLTTDHSRALEKRGLGGHPDVIARFGSLGENRIGAVSNVIRRSDLERHFPHVPGLAIRENYGRRYWSVTGKGGLLIPVRDAVGRIVAISVRVDGAAGGDKYRWVSSKKFGGPSPGSPFHVPLFAGDKTVVRLTEGALKADVATALSGMLTIGMPGVTMWRRAAGVLTAVGATTVRVALDADFRTNANVCGALNELLPHLQSKGFTVEMEVWDGPVAKGIDDALVAGTPISVLDFDAACKEAAAAAGILGVGAPGNMDAVDGSAANKAVDDPCALARGFLARRHAHADGPTLRYFRENWHRWDGSAWPEVSKDEVRAHVVRYVERVLDEGNLDKVAAWLAAGGKGEAPTAQKVSGRLVSDVLQALVAETIVPAATEPPAWLDGQGRADLRLALFARNGVVDLAALTAGQADFLTAASPRLLNFTALPFDFNLHAPQPTAWLKFLDGMWPNESDSIAALQEWFGYTITADTSLQKILLIVGPPRSGKGTVAHVLQRLVGEANTCAPTLSDLAERFGLWPLVGKSLAIVGDALLSGRADSAQITERLKSISGEDPQTVDRKNREPVTCRLSARFMILTNELPRLADSSAVIVSRLVLLRTITSHLGREDIGLKARLEAELPGILLWAVAGWQSLRRRGRFVQPASGDELLRQMRGLAAPIQEFVEECCTIDPEQSTDVKALFDAWTTWSEQNGFRGPGTVQLFGRDLRAAVPGVSRERPRVGGQRTRRFVGIGLTNPPRRDFDEAE